MSRKRVMCTSLSTITANVLAILWTILVILPRNTDATALNNEDQLYKDLFRNYNKYVRPLRNTSMSVDVTVSFVINSLMDIKEREEQMVTVGFLKTIWYDNFLVWDPEKYGGVNRMIVPAETIWLPDIAISNSVSKYYDITYKRDFHVHISHTGKVRWSFGGIFSSSCMIHLEEYPFDVQNCYIEIENWMYSIHDVNLIFPESEAIVISQIGPNAVWELLDSSAQRQVKYEEFASLKFSLKWKRKSLYYYVNIVIPIVLMLLVALGVFWLPAECGEKMSLAISVVLAFSVFQIIIMETTPVNSDVVPEITELVMLVMILATTSLLSSMLAVYISGRSTNTRAPAWLRFVSFNVMAKILCMQNGIPKKEDDNKKKYTIDIVENGCKKSNKKHGKWQKNHEQHIKENGKSFENMEALSMINHHGNEFNSDFNSKFDQSTADEQAFSPKLTKVCNAVNRILSIMEEEESSDFTREEWKCIAKITDRVVFWLTMIALGGSLIYIFVDF